MPTITQSLWHSQKVDGDAPPPTTDSDAKNEGSFHLNAGTHVHGLRIALPEEATEICPDKGLVFGKGIDCSITLDHPSVSLALAYRLGFLLCSATCPLSTRNMHFNNEAFNKHLLSWSSSWKCVGSKCSSATFPIPTRNTHSNNEAFNKHLKLKCPQSVSQIRHQIDFDLRSLLPTSIFIWEVYFLHRHLLVRCLCTWHNVICGSTSPTIVSFAGVYASC